MSNVKNTGKIMNYEEFARVFNHAIFDKSKSALVEKIASQPQRYVGLFRPTKPRAKITQNLLQSHEIKFGDAFEIVIESYLRQFSFSILDKRLVLPNGQHLLIDHLFYRDNSLYFVEQKIRDDHDSSKRRGQIENFQRKLEVLCAQHQRCHITGFFYFIDDSFTKNINFYRQEINDLASAHSVTLHLVYGREFFKLIGASGAWDEILTHLMRWKESIPEFPEINLDANAAQSFAEIKGLPASVFRRLLSNTELDGVLCILFPARETLALLANHFQQQADGNDERFTELLNLCRATITRLENYLP